MKEDGCGKSPSKEHCWHIHSTYCERDHSAWPEAPCLIAVESTCCFCGVNKRSVAEAKPIIDQHGPFIPTTSSVGGCTKPSNYDMKMIPDPDGNGGTFDFDLKKYIKDKFHSN